MANGDRLIEAAGGLLWRPARNGDGPEICIVHRPKYDDYSIPKGKLGRGEHVLLAAAREVTEETGFIATIGAHLGEINYLKDGTPKRVRFWAMQAAGGEFAPNAEVDRVLWLTPDDALAMLSPNRDPSIVAAFAADPTPTVPLVVVRHASAGDLSSWTGDDRDRPLDEVGRAQAAAFAELLPLFGITATLSADVLRCTETVKLFADKASITVDSEPLLSEIGFAQNRTSAINRLLDIADMRLPTALCSQGTVIPELVSSLCASYGFRPPRDTSLRKGEAWVAQLAVGERRILSLERMASLP
ncbi:MAG: hydrolase [Frankiales bacterium]|nr:hydrolase [Frankiales bacterium]